MNDLELYTHEIFGSIRIMTDEDGSFLFCGNDVATALGYANSRKAISDHCRCVTKRYTPHPQSPSKQIEMTFLPEGDLYRLIAHSKLPDAQKFESWIFDDLLPTIRKTGGYIANVDMVMDSYFYGVEGPAKEIIRESLLALNKQKAIISEQRKQLDEQQPRVEFADTVLKSCDNIYMNDMAKLLCHEGLNIGGKQLFSLLRDNGVLMQDNIPYQSYIDRGYFLVKEGTYTTPYGVVKLSRTTLVTPKGQLWLTSKVKSLMDT